MYLKHDRSLLTFNTEEAQLTNILPPFDIWHTMNSNLKSDLVHDMVGQVKVHYNDRDSEKLIGSYFDTVTKSRQFAKSENYQPETKLYLDVNDGQRYIEQLNRVNFQIDGAFNTEMDLYLHEIQRYFNTLYPESERALALFTPEEINDSYNEVCHMLGFSFDAASIDEIVWSLTDLNDKDRDAEALFQKYKMFTSFGQARQNLGSIRSIRSFINRLGFKTRLFNLAYIAENEGTKFQKYAVQSLVLKAKEAVTVKRAAASIPYASEFLASLDINPLTEQIKQTALTSTPIKISDSFTLINLVSETYSSQISKNLQTYSSASELLPNSVFAKAIDGLGNDIAKSMFEIDKPMSTILSEAKDNVYVLADDSISKSTYSFYVLKEYNDDLKRIRSITDDEIYTIANNSGAFVYPYNIRNPEYPIIIQKYSNPAYSQMYKDYFRAFLSASREPQISKISDFLERNGAKSAIEGAAGAAGLSKAFFQYSRILNDNELIGYFIRSGANSNVLFTNLDAVEDLKANPILVRDGRQIIANGDTITTEDYYVPAKAFVALLIDFMVKHGFSYSDSEIANIKNLFINLSVGSFEITSSYHDGLIKAFGLIGSKLGFKDASEYDDLIMRKIVNHEEVDTGVLNTAMTVKYVNYSRDELVNDFIRANDGTAEHFRKVISLLKAVPNVNTELDYNYLTNIERAVLEVENGTYTTIGSSIDFKPVYTAQGGIYTELWMRDQITTYCKDEVYEPLYISKSYEEHYALKAMRPLYTYSASYANASWSIGELVDKFSKVVDNLYQDEEVLKNGYYLKIPAEKYAHIPASSLTFNGGSEGGASTVNKSTLASIVGNGCYSDEEAESAGATSGSARLTDEEAFDNVYIDIRNGSLFAHSYDDAVMIKHGDTLRLVVANENAVVYVQNNPLEKEDYGIIANWHSKPTFLDTEVFEGVRAIVMHRSEKRSAQIGLSVKSLNEFTTSSLPEKLEDKIQTTQNEVKQTSLSSIPVVEMRKIYDGGLVTPVSLSEFIGDAVPSRDSIISSSDLDIDASTVTSSSNLLLVDLDKTFKVGDQNYLMTQQILDAIKDNVTANFDTIYSKPLEIGVSIDSINERGANGAFVYNQNTRTSAFLMNFNQALLPNKIEIYSTISDKFMKMLNDTIARAEDSSLFVDYKFVGNSLTMWESAIWNDASIVDENKYIRSIWSSILDYVKRKTHEGLSESFFSEAFSGSDKVYEGNITKLSYGNVSYFDKGNEASFYIKDQHFDNNFLSRKRLALTGKPLKAISPERMFNILGISNNSSASITNDDFSESSYNDCTDVLSDLIMKHRMTDEEASDPTLAKLNGIQSLTTSSDIYKFFHSDELTAPGDFEFVQASDKTFGNNFSVAMNAILFADMTAASREVVHPLCSAIGSLAASWNKVYKRSMTKGEFGWLLRSTALLSQRISYSNDKFVFSEIDPNTAISFLQFDENGDPQIFFAQPTSSEGNEWCFYEYVGSIMELASLPDDRNLKWFGLVTNSDAIGPSNNLVAFTDLTSDQNGIIMKFLKYTFASIRNDESKISSGRIHIYVPTNAKGKEVSIDTKCYKFKTGRTLALNQKALTSIDEDDVVTSISVLQFLDPLTDNEQESDTLLLHDICYSLRRPDYDESLLPKFVDNFIDLGDNLTAVAAREDEDATWIVAMTNPMAAEDMSYDLVKQIKSLDSSDARIAKFNDAFSLKNKIKLPNLKLHKTALSGMTEEFEEGNLAAKYFKNRLLVKGKVYVSDPSTVILEGVDDTKISRVLSSGDSVIVAGYGFQGSTDNVAQGYGLYDLATANDLRPNLFGDEDVIDAIASSNYKDFYGLAIVRDPSNGKLRLRKYAAPIGGIPVMETYTAQLPIDELKAAYNTNNTGKEGVVLDSWKDVETNDCSLFIDDDGKLCLTMSVTISGTNSKFSRSYTLTTDKSITDSLKDDTWINGWLQHNPAFPAFGVSFNAQGVSATDESDETSPQLKYDIKVLDGTVGQLVDDPLSKWYESSAELLGMQSLYEYFNVKGIVSALDTPSLIHDDVGLHRLSPDTHDEPRVHIGTIESRYIEHSKFGELLEGKDKDFYYDSGFLYVHTYLRGLQLEAGVPLGSYSFQGVTYTDYDSAQSALESYYGSRFVAIHDPLRAAIANPNSTLEEKIALEAEAQQKEDELQEEVNLKKRDMMVAFQGVPQVSTKSPVGKAVSDHKYWKEINLGMLHFKNKLGQDSELKDAKEIAESYVKDKDNKIKDLDQLKTAGEVARYYMKDCASRSIPGSVFKLSVPRVVGVTGNDENGTGGGNVLATRPTPAVFYFPGMSQPNNKSIGDTIDGMAQIAAESWIDPSMLVVDDSTFNQNGGTAFEQGGSSSVDIKHKFAILPSETNITMIDKSRWTCAATVSLSDIEFSDSAFIEAASLLDELKYMPKAEAESSRDNLENLDLEHDFDNIRQYVIVPKSYCNNLEKNSPEVLFEGEHGTAYQEGVAYYEEFKKEWAKYDFAKQYNLDDYRAIAVRSTIEQETPVMPENNLSFVRKGSCIIIYGHIVAPQYDEFRGDQFVRDWLMTNRARLEHTAAFEAYNNTFLTNEEIVSGSADKVKEFYNTYIAGMKIGVIATSSDSLHFSLLDAKTTYDDVVAATLLDDSETIGMQFVSTLGGTVYCSSSDNISPAGLRLVSYPLMKIAGDTQGQGDRVPAVIADYTDFSNYKTNTLSHLKYSEHAMTGGKSTVSLAKAVLKMSNFDQKAIKMTFNESITTVNIVSGLDFDSEDFDGTGLKFSSDSRDTGLPMTVVAATDSKIYLNTSAVATGTPLSSFEVLLSISTKLDIPDQSEFIDFAANYKKYFDIQTLGVEIPVFDETTKQNADRIYFEKMSRTASASELAQLPGFPALIEDKDHIYYNYKDDGSVQPMKNAFGNDVVLVDANNHFIDLKEDGEGGYVANPSLYQVLAKGDLTPTTAPDAKTVSVRTLTECFNPEADILLGDAEATFISEGLVLIKAAKQDLSSLKFASADALASTDAMFTTIYSIDPNVVKDAWLDYQDRMGGPFDLWYLAARMSDIIAEGHALDYVDLHGRTVEEVEAEMAAFDGLSISLEDFYNKPDGIDAFAQVARLTNMISQPKAQELLETDEYKEALAEAKATFMSTVFTPDKIYNYSSNARDCLSPSFVLNNGKLSYRKKLSRAIAKFSEANILHAFTYGRLDEVGDEYNYLIFNDVDIDIEKIENPEDKQPFTMLLPGLVVAADYPEVEYESETKPEMVSYYGSMSSKIQKPYAKMVLPFGGYGFAMEQSNKALSVIDSYKEAYGSDYYVPWPESKDGKAIGMNTFLDPLFKSNTLLNAKDEPIMLIDPTSHEDICEAKAWVYPNFRTYVNATSEFAKAYPIEEELVNYKDAIVSYTVNGEKHISLLLNKKLINKVESNRILLDAEKIKNSEGTYTLFDYQGIMPNLVATVLASNELDLNPENSSATQTVNLTVYDKMANEISEAVGYSRVYSSYVHNSDDGTLNLDSIALTYTARNASGTQVSYMPDGNPKQGNIWSLMNPRLSEKVLVADENGELVYAFKKKVPGELKSTWENACDIYRNLSQEVQSIANPIYYNVSHKIQILAMNADTSYVTDYFKNYIDDFGANYVYDLQANSYKSHDLYDPYIYLANKSITSVPSSTRLPIDRYDIKTGALGDLEMMAIAPVVAYSLGLSAEDYTKCDHTNSGLTNIVNSSIEREYELCVNDISSSLTIKDDAGIAGEKIERADTSAYLEYYFYDSFYKKVGEADIKAIIVKDKTEAIREIYILQNKISLDLSKSPLVINRLITTSLANAKDLSKEEQ